MIRHDVDRTHSPLRVGVAAMLVITMMLLGAPGVRAQGLVELSLSVPILMENCRPGNYKVQSFGGMALEGPVTVNAAADPSGQGCLVRVKTSVALPAQPVGMQTEVAGGVLIMSNAKRLSSSDGSVVYEVVAEAKTIPPSEGVSFNFRPIK